MNPIYVDQKKYQNTDLLTGIKGMLIIAGSYGKMGFWHQRAV
jgi:hypothetical protein